MTWQPVSIFLLILHQPLQSIYRKIPHNTPDHVVEGNAWRHFHVGNIMSFFTFPGSSSQKSNIKQQCPSSDPEGTSDCCTAGWGGSEGPWSLQAPGGFRLPSWPSGGDCVLVPRVTDTAGSAPGPDAGEVPQGQQPGMAGGRSGNSTFPCTWHRQAVDELLITPVQSPGVTRKSY